MNRPQQPPRAAEAPETTERSPRLRGQLRKLYEAMCDGEWHTVQFLATVIGAKECSTSARIRDLRKPQFGAFKVERRKAGNLHHYRLASGQRVPIGADEVNARAAEAVNQSKRDAKARAAAKAGPQLFGG